MATGELQDERQFDLDVGEAETFVKSRVWKLLASDILTKAYIASEENDHLDPIAQPVAIARNQGAIEALKWVVDMPGLYAQEAKQIKEDKEEERKDG